MKKILLALLFVFSVCLSAQEHFKFCGIQITGGVSFVQQELQKKGFQYDKQGERLGAGKRLLKGKYAGYDSRVALFYNESNFIVHHIIVMPIYYAETNKKAVKNAYLAQIIEDMRKEDYWINVSSANNNLLAVSKYNGNEFVTIGLILIKQDDDNIMLTYDDILNSEQYDK